MKTRAVILVLPVILASCGKDSDTRIDKTPAAPVYRPGSQTNVKNAEDFFQNIAFTDEFKEDGSHTQTLLSTEAQPDTKKKIRSGISLFEVELRLKKDHTFEFRYGERKDAGSPIEFLPPIKDFWEIESQGRCVLPGVGYATASTQGGKPAVLLTLEHDFKTEGVRNSQVTLTVTKQLFPK